MSKMKLKKGLEMYENWVYFILCYKSYQPIGKFEIYYLRDYWMNLE